MTGVRRIGEIVIVLAVAQHAGFSQNYLSNLSATRIDPLFSTYAAPLARSEFILDEGYQFMWNDLSTGANFGTDNAGSLCLGFKMNGDFRYRLNQFFDEPVVTTSYSDLVKYHFHPFEDLLVEVFFDVYSSRMAIEDVSITNLGTLPAVLTVYPHFYHESGVVTNVGLLVDSSGFLFQHREPPDGWTTGHGVPYQEEVLDIFLIDSNADAFGAYSTLGTLPPVVTSVRANYCLEKGTVLHADGSPCLHLPLLAQQVVLHNGTDTEILTEAAPQWGNPDPNIPGNGYQSCELGNFRNPAIAADDSFTVFFTCSGVGQQGAGGGRVPSLPVPDSVRTDIQLQYGSLVVIPQNVQAHFAQNNESAVVWWDHVPGYRYSVFRRTRSTPGRYDRIAADLDGAGYLDIGLDADSAYGYVVTARDSTGVASGHSVEVGNIAQWSASFFADVANASLQNRIPSGSMKVVALQRNLVIPAGGQGHLRIVRGVAEAGGDTAGLLGQAHDLMRVNLDQEVAADEQSYGRIPRLGFTNPDYEMMYWGAFSMMRQCMLPSEAQCSTNYNVYSREPTWGWGHAGQVFHENLSMLAYAFMDPLSAQSSQRVFADRMGAQPEWPAGYVPYRVGPYLNEVNYLAGEHTSSAPWFNWENWEIFLAGGDTTFLLQIYDSGRAFHDFWVNERDDDHDGLSEWGGHAFWESVRDYNVIWDLLGGWADPHSANRVEALDLNCELVMEEKSLARMAGLLGREAEAQLWRQRAQARADSINRFMWDPVTRFYYHVEKQTHTFTYQTLNDLKRKEIIGFLPLWAGIVDSVRAEFLLQELNDPNTFGRPYGVPLLAHNDPYGGYDAHAVYPEWDFLVFKGLMESGYILEGQRLADRLFSGIVRTLKDRHDFYESYHCDEQRPSDSWLHTYLWTGVVARMLIDLQALPVGVREQGSEGIPDDYVFEQNYPNPFNARTMIEFSVPKSGPVTLRIFNLIGQEIVTLVHEVVSPGTQRVPWDGMNAEGRAVSSGMYFCRFDAGGARQMRKMILLR